LSPEQLERLGRYTAPPESYPNRMLVEQAGLDFATVTLRRR
jgi:hypothetical protein